jgi:RsiW-degrading membrane proteinase PrsW (M82 family)
MSSLITLAGLLLFIGISALIPRPANSSWAFLLSVFLAVIPALVWLGFFYQQDRAEPEPKQLVARIFVFGALAAVVMPFVDQTIGQTVGQVPGLALRIVLTILTIALIQEVLKIGMVRYVVLGTREFDYHQDGIVYGLAAGLGFATVLTLAYFLSTDGVIPLSGAIRAVDNALVHGALGAVSGYYIGRVKIDGKGAGWLIQGLTIVTIVDGLYYVIGDELTRRLTFNPWYSLGAAFILAVVAGLVLFAFFRRAQLRTTGALQTVSIQVHARSKEMPWDIHVRYDYVLVGALALALVIGWTTNWVMTSRTVSFADSDLLANFRYPAGWAVERADSSSVTIRDLTGAGVSKPAISVSSGKTRSSAALDLLVAQEVTAYSNQKPLYIETERVEVQVAGNLGTEVSYEYAASTASGPVVIRGVATYVLVNSRLYTLRYEAETDIFLSGLTRYKQVLRSVHFAPEQ